MSETTHFIPGRVILIWIVVCGIIVSASVAAYADPAPVTIDVRCREYSAWIERFHYADDLARTNHLDEAREILEPGLKDHCPAIRSQALHALRSLVADDGIPKTWPIAYWKLLKPRIEDLESVLVWLVPLLVILGLVLLVSRKSMRRSMAVQALTVSNGAGFDGHHFVAIALDTSFRAGLLGKGLGGVPASSPTAPRMILDQNTLTEDLVGVLPDAPTKRFLIAVSTILRRPRYVCSGSVHFIGRSSHIIVQLQKGGRVLGSWERFSPAPRLIEDLRDLYYLSYAATRSDLRE